ncbi:hypothetical protein NQ117_14815 [Paenibacillus sp. SC116]|uniref:HalD/BesD family halogenase n=1 Tax=Paenibacillus sp. SC116 TaxID=2968986 RepID=UPI00215A9B01|nr:hypothetical protein [Paenibacillus sp. SC116]MCR8844951.1 hypothetical protein [Paenibacillus sp. SC116]
MEYQAQFDGIVQEHLNQLPADAIQQMQDSFTENDVIILDCLLPEELRLEMEKEAMQILSEHGKRRDLVIKETGNTPRHFNSVGRESIAQHGKLIPAFFSSQPIQYFLSSLNNGKTVLPVPYQPEEFIINSQQATGDTHGWHWDDYTFALIWMVEAPGPNDGALIEYIPKTEWDRENAETCVQQILDTNEVKSLYVPQGCCYFMKANTTLHRVSALKNDSRRTVIVYTYASNEDLQKEISHETMEQIWAEEIVVVPAK